MAANLVRNVTRDNYLSLAMAFSRTNEKTHVLCLTPRFEHGERIPATVAQWGAWRAYYWGKNIPHAFMDCRAKEGKVWSVPAAWPHEFDADASLQDDHSHGERFRRNHRPENIEMADLARRKIFAAAVRREFPRPGRRPETPADHLRMPALHDPAPPASDEPKQQLLDTGYGHLVTPHASAA